jgi:hypothetical protein
MRIGSSLFLIAVGAVLRFAVTVSSSAVNLHTVGVILMIVGAIGLLFSLLWLGVWSDRDERTVRRHTYVEREAPVETVRTVRER